jgi:phosphotriesterase-related protein
VLRAAVAAQRELGCALTIHPGRHPDAPDEILALVAAEGADMSRVILCHVDRTADSVEAVLRWAETGCVIEYDLFGVEPPNQYYDDLGIRLPTDDERLDVVETLMAAGFGHQIAISHDLCFKHQLRRLGGFGRDHIFRKVIPKMRDRGFTQADIDTILVDNPRRVLAVAG